MKYGTMTLAWEQHSLVKSCSKAEPSTPRWEVKHFACFCSQGFGVKGIVVAHKVRHGAVKISAEGKV